MAKITLETYDRIKFPKVRVGFKGVGIVISGTEAFLIEIGSRSGPVMEVGPIPSDATLLQESVKFEAKVAMDAVEIMLKHSANS